MLKLHKARFLFCTILWSCSSFYSAAQSLVNGDLEGDILLSLNQSVVAPGWQRVPETDPNCLATSPVTATPDLTSLIGPSTIGGINGNPYSGLTFMSGVRSEPDFVNTHHVFHEGIMQTVSGFVINNTYKIGFMQAVVKQINCLDQSGSWAVYLDTILLDIVAPTFSSAPYNSNSFNWDARSVIFTATSSTHTLKFLPEDDDLDLIASVTNVNGALRMGIDSIYLKCIVPVNLGNDTSICPGQSLIISAGVIGATYSWNNGQTTPNITINQPGIYTVTVTRNGCIGTDTIIIQGIPLPVLNLGSNIVLCLGDTIILSAGPVGGSYSWQNGSTAPTFQVTHAGMYWVTATSNGCTASDSVIVEYRTKPVVNLGNDSTLCVGQSLVLTAGGTGVTYSWQNGSTLPSYIVTQPGTYWVSVNNNGCSATDSIFVNFNAVPAVNIGSDTSLCVGQSLLLFAGNPGASYNWQNGSTLPNFTVSQAGTYWVSVTSNGCTTTDTVAVQFLPFPTINLGADTTMCFGQTLLLTASTPNSTFVWNNNSTNPSFLVTQPGTYWVTATSNSCSTTDSIIIDYRALPVVNLGNDTSLCAGHSLQLSAWVSSVGNTYSWQDGSSSANFNVTQPGNYWVAVTSNGCTGTDSITVSFNDLTVFLGNDTTFCDGDVLLLKPLVENAWLSWQDGSSGPSYTVTQAGAYWVEASRNGCTARSEIKIETMDCSPELVMPNIFTPNQDGVNDVFKPIIAKNIASWSFNVVTRWGDKIFETDQIGSGWDGRNQNNQPAAEGIYFYVISYQSVRGEQEVRKGWLTLVR